MNSPISQDTPPDQLPDQLELLIADMSGMPRGKEISGASFNAQELPHLPAAVLFQTLTGDYADVMHEYNPKDEDLLLQPDWSTYRAVPWRDGKHGQVICHSKDKSGVPVDYDPRNVLSRVLDAYSALGLTPIVAPEIEFYLVDVTTDATTPLGAAKGFNGQADQGGEAFSIDALSRYDSFLSRLKRCCADSDLQLTAVVHEMGPGQIELNVAHGEVLSRADQLFLLKRAVKACAAAEGVAASFMAKPLEGLPGSGLHLHISALDAKGANVFALDQGAAPAELRRFIGGLQTYLPKAFALISPNVNSYKRFVRDLSAPINLEWGYDNRTTGFRVPYGDDANGRVENRIAGADASPYLFMAATLACGLLGLQQKLEPSVPVDGDAYELPAELPADLSDALVSLANCTELTQILGKSFIDVYVDVKTTELVNFRSEISPWERRFLATQV